MTQHPQIRNVTALPDGRYDCEIDHPHFGWVPFTASQADPLPHGRAIWAAIAESRGELPK